MRPVLTCQIRWYVSYAFNLNMRVLMLLFCEEFCRTKLSRPPLYVAWPKALNYSILRNSGNWPSKSNIPPQLTSFYQRETDQKGLILRLFLQFRASICRIECRLYL